MSDDPDEWEERPHAHGSEGGVQEPAEEEQEAEPYELSVEAREHGGVVRRRLDDCREALGHVRHEHEPEEGDDNERGVGGEAAHQQRWEARVCRARDNEEGLQGEKAPNGKDGGEYVARAVGEAVGAGEGAGAREICVEELMPVRDDDKEEARAVHVLGDDTLRHTHTSIEEHLDAVRQHSAVAGCPVHRTIVVVLPPSRRVGRAPHAARLADSMGEARREPTAKDRHGMALWVAEDGRVAAPPREALELVLRKQLIAQTKQMQRWHLNDRSGCAEWSGERLPCAAANVEEQPERVGVAGGEEGCEEAAVAYAANHRWRVTHEEGVGVTDACMHTCGLVARVVTPQAIVKARRVHTVQSRLDERCVQLGHRWCCVHRIDAYKRDVIFELDGPSGPTQ